MMEERKKGGVGRERVERYICGGRENGETERKLKGGKRE